jgi:Domain of unknown function (DUF3846)
MSSDASTRGLRVLHITANGAVEKFVPRKTKLKSLQELVGGNLESYPCTFSHDGCVLYVNEDGLNLRLPLNRVLTAALGSEVVGDGVLSAADRHGNTVSLPTNINEDNWRSCIT